MTSQQDKLSSVGSRCSASGMFLKFGEVVKTLTCQLPIIKVLLNLWNENTSNTFWTESMSKPKILFLCTGNSVRSQMAEAFLRKYGGDHFQAYSAGVRPSGLNPLTVKVMNEVGIDVSKQVSKGPEAYLGTTLFKEVINVCEEAEENSPTAWVALEIRTHWPFEDPAMFEGTEEQKLAKFREVRDQIEKKVKEWLVKQDITDQ